MAALARAAVRIATAPPPTLLVAGLLIALLHGAYVIWQGVLWAPDSAAYAHWSARLVESGFDFPAVLGEAQSEFPPALYVLFGTLLALLRTLFGELWPAALVGINLATHVGLGLLIIRLTGRATGSGAASWAALLLYLGCSDLLAWVPFVLSDSTFVFLAFCIFFIAARRILGLARGWLPIIGPAAAGVFYRPTGIVLLPDLAWSVYLSSARRAPHARAVLAAAVITALSGTFLFAWFMQDPSRWPFDTLSTAFETVSRGYAQGEVVSGRPETHHLPPQGLLDIVLISLDRFAHFFAIGASDFSIAHALASAAFLLPCYALACWLLFSLLRGGTRFEAGQRKVFLASAGAVFAYAVFHGLVQVDFDWRYRVPILPHLILLAGGGVADLLSRAQRP